METLKNQGKNDRFHDSEELPARSVLAGSRPVGRAPHPGIIEGNTTD
jgi:hypothetical protein